MALILSRGAWALLSLLNRESAGRDVPQHLVPACAELYSFGLVAGVLGRVCVTDKGKESLREKGKVR